MRLVTYESDRGARAGVLHDGRVLDAWDAVREPHPRGAHSVRQLLAQDLVGELASHLDGAGDGLPLDDATLLPPIPDPDKIVCIGLNYGKHAAEAGIDPPNSPTFFAKFRNALAPPDVEVPIPTSSDKVDFEAEVAFVIGRRCQGATEKDALDHVAGYTLLNDLSARDLQFATPQWMPGKVFDGAAPCGPALVTPDEAGAPDSISFELALNGETMQSASTDDLIFGISALVSHLSSLMTLEPGDIVSTGTPSGVGSVREPSVWLKPSDEIVITSPTLGTLATRIAA
jgi:2-keto-4-pentenoate hydratase/2-oxohepta-3-ene-1,7-dioic acid hydratase in catechol pathway